MSNLLNKTTMSFIERLNESATVISNIDITSVCNASRINNYSIINTTTQYILQHLSGCNYINWAPGNCHKEYLNGLINIDYALGHILNSKLLFIIQARSDFYYSKMKEAFVRNINSTDYVAFINNVYDFSSISNIHIHNALPHWNVIFSSVSGIVYISCIIILGSTLINGVKLNKLNIPYSNVMFKFIIYTSIPSLVNAELYSCVPLNISSNVLIGILCGIGIPLYIILGAWFDNCSIKMQLRKTMKSSIFIRMLVGSIYSIQIGVGIFATNGLYYALYKVKGLTLFIASTIIAIIAGSVWHLLRIPTTDLDYDLVNSMFRSITEAVFFAAICISTFVSWAFTINNIQDSPGMSSLNIALTVCIIIGLIGYIILGLIVIMLDSTFFKRMRFRRALYGVFYAIWFTFVLFCSNGVVELFQLHLPLCDYYNYVIWISLGIVSSIATIFTYPEFYPFNTYSSEYIHQDIDLETGQPNDVWDIWKFKHKAYYLVYLHFCIQCYCFGYGLAWYSLSQLF